MNEKIIFLFPSRYKKNLLIFHPWKTTKKNPIKKQLAHHPLPPSPPRYLSEHLYYAGVLLMEWWVPSFPLIKKTFETITLCIQHSSHQIHKIQGSSYKNINFILKKLFKFNSKSLVSRRTKDLLLLFDPKVHLFENSLLKPIYSSAAQLQRNIITL